MSRQRSAGAGREAASVGTGGLRRGTAGGAAEPMSRTCSRSGSRQTPSSRGFPWHGSEKARGEGLSVPFSGAIMVFNTCVVPAFLWAGVKQALGNKMHLGAVREDKATLGTGW